MEVFHGDYDGHPEFFEDEADLHKYLSKISSKIGWIVIRFNSIEDFLAQALRDLLLNDSVQDERLDIFLTEMGFKQKASALLTSYEQACHNRTVHLPENELSKLRAVLDLAATIRNGYAHAAWSNGRENSYIKVNSVSKKQGLCHRYRRIDTQTADQDIEFLCSILMRLESVHELIVEQIHGFLHDDINNISLPKIIYPPEYKEKFDKPTRYEITEDIKACLENLGFNKEEIELSMRAVNPNSSVASGLKAAVGFLSKNAKKA